MARVYDMPALVSETNGERLVFGTLPTFPTSIQVYASSSNTGVIWVGGQNITAGRGIPMKPDSSMFFGHGEAYTLAKFYFWFEKAGDTLYGLCVIPSIQE